MGSPSSDKNLATEPRYPTNGPKQEPFSFDSSGFRVSRIARESGKSLKKLLFPELLATEIARKSAKKDASIITAPWVKAQLHHYGINFKPDLDPFEAKALLLTCVAQGLCDEVPPQILDIKAKLKEEYQGMMAKYRTDMKVFDDLQLPERVKKFELCATPTEEAKCDPSLFLRKYFLNASGHPDRSKTPGLLLLPGYIDRGLALSGRTDRVPALHVANGGLGGTSNIMVIGWDRIKVNKKATAIDMEKSHGRGVLREYQNWEAQMKRHLELTRKYPKHPFEPDETTQVVYISGIYALKADSIKYDWPTISNELRLRLFGEGLAIFDLGIVVGMMVLAETQERLVEVIEKHNWNSSDYQKEMEDGLLEDDVSSNSDEVNEDQGSQLGHVSDFDMEADLEIDPPPLKPKVNSHKLRSDNPGRLYFQWRGYNTQSGEIQIDPDNKNTGYLDFADIIGTEFHGVINMPKFGGAISIQGYKIPGLIGPVNMNWNELSHLASERAKAPERWL